MGWNETPAGRVRLWCIYCQREGRAWDTPEICQHILYAKTEQTVTEELGRQYRQELQKRYQQELEQQALQASPKPPYHPIPLEPTEPASAPTETPTTPPSAAAPS